jgi:hypothetical protein
VGEVEALRARLAALEELVDVVLDLHWNLGVARCDTILCTLRARRKLDKMKPIEGAEVIILTVTGGSVSGDGDMLRGVCLDDYTGGDTPLLAAFQAFPLGARVRLSPCGDEEVNRG